jgi:hypothetical protein
LLEKVVQKEFPEELSLSVEELACVQDSTLEKTKVLEAKKSTVWRRHIRHNPTVRLAVEYCMYI